VESFNYLSVLLSILIGLAITQVLQGLRQLILTRTKVKLYLPTLIWAGLALLIAVQGWWASFQMHLRANWTFLGLLVVMLHAISLYMITAWSSRMSLENLSSICENTILRTEDGSSLQYLLVPFSVSERASLSAATLWVDRTSCFTPSSLWPESQH
jgi:hypothetical protein